MFSVEERSPENSPPSIKTQLGLSHGSGTWCSHDAVFGVRERCWDFLCTEDPGAGRAWGTGLWDPTWEGPNFFGMLSPGQIAPCACDVHSPRELWLRKGRQCLCSCQSGSEEWQRRAVLLQKGWTFSRREQQSQCMCGSLSFSARDLATVDTISITNIPPFKTLAPSQEDRRLLQAGEGEISLTGLLSPWHLS